MASAIRQERDAQDTRTSANLSTNIWTGDGTRGQENGTGEWELGTSGHWGVLGVLGTGPRQTTRYALAATERAAWQIVASFSIIKCANGR